MNRELIIPPWLDRLLGHDPASQGEGLETTIIHTWPWPSWATLLLLLAAAAYVFAVYARERGGARKRTRVLLATIRVLLIGLLVFLMFGWLRHQHRTDLPDLLVGIDVSGSMSTIDPTDDKNSDQRGAATIARVTDAGFPDATRLNQAKALLLENNSALLNALAQRYHLKFQLVGGSARPAIPADSTAPDSVGDPMSNPTAKLADAIRELEPSDPASRLGKCLRDLLESQRGRPTAAIVLFTDGVTTEGKSLGELAAYARRKTVPLYLVGLGNEQPPRDVRVTDLLVDEVAFVGDPLNFDFKVVGAGYPGKQVTLRLLRAGQATPLDQTTITFGKTSEPQSVRLVHRPREKGDFEFTVEAEALPGEVNPENNRITRTVRVREETIRVLFVQEYPSYEFRFLKTLLSRGLKQSNTEGAASEKAIELKTVLQEADADYVSTDETALRVFPVSRDELLQFDVLLFGDTNPAFLSRSILENIVEVVTQRGRSVVFLSGPRHTPLAYRDSPLTTLFPVELSTAVAPLPDVTLERPYSVRLTRLGLQTPHLQLADTPAATARVWQELPGLYWHLEAPDVKPGVRVLVEHASRAGSVGQNLPVVAVQFVGAGKVLFHATDETSRWSRSRDGEQHFERYWMQTLRYLSRSKLGADRSTELTSGRDEYRSGEPVELRVRFFDESRSPPQDDGVLIILEREGSHRRQVRLHRDATNRGDFTGTVSNLPEGQYHAWIVTPTLDGPPSHRFSVVAPPGEFAKLELDLPDLRLAAQTSQGKLYTFDTASQLLADLPRGRQVRIESLPPTPIWNSPLFAGLFVVLIVSEWLLRKRAGML